VEHVFAYRPTCQLFLPFRMARLIRSTTLTIDLEVALLAHEELGQVLVVLGSHGAISVIQKLGLGSIRYVANTSKKKTIQPVLVPPCGR
jgi:hypothetical protein